MAQTYACAPKIVGGPEGTGHSPPRCPAEESRCPVVAHDWVNDEYKHLVVKATPKALAATRADSSSCFVRLLTRSRCGSAARKVSTVSPDRAGGWSFSTRSWGVARRAWPP